MNANYPTAVSVSQTALRFAPTSGSMSSKEGGLRTAVPSPVHRCANREMRKALRAAEMAAWEAVAPSTKPEPAQGAQASSLRDAVRTVSRQGIDRESLLIGILTGTAMIGLLITVQDTSALLTHWSQFVATIRNLLV